MGASCDSGRGCESGGAIEPIRHSEGRRDVKTRKSSTRRGPAPAPRWPRTANPSTIPHEAPPASLRSGRTPPSSATGGGPGSAQPRRPPPRPPRHRRSPPPWLAVVVSRRPTHARTGVITPPRHRSPPGRSPFAGRSPRRRSPQRPSRRFPGKRERAGIPVIPSPVGSGCARRPPHARRSLREPSALSTSASDTRPRYRSDHDDRSNEHGCRAESPPAARAAE